MRRLIAALACRNNGSRLYGKPLQNLAPGKTVLDQILDVIDRCQEIDAVVLGISEGADNQVFAKIAQERGVQFVFGDERDVLYRLILCGRDADATDIFRVTTECPFFDVEPLGEAWKSHVEDGNDITVTDGLPEGTNFEIYTLESLERSHNNGTDEHRSEMCSRYAKHHSEEFQIEVLPPRPYCGRTDLRLTVDYPEDLIVCREVYKAFSDQAPLIPLRDIINFLDHRPDLRKMIEPYTSHSLEWPGMGHVVESGG